MCRCWRWVPDGAVWDEELLLGTITVAWGRGQAEDLCCTLVLARQGRRARVLKGQHVSLAARPAPKPHRSVLSHSTWWPWLPLPPGLGSGHQGLGLALMPPAPSSACLGAELLPASLLHIGTHGWGLEAVGLSPAVVPGAALCCIHPPCKVGAAAFLLPYPTSS